MIMEEKAVSTEVKKPDALSVLLRQDSIKKRFEEVLGKKAAGFMSSIISATNANKELKKADPLSIVSAAAVAAALDLPINPSLGFAHIVPYKKDGVAIAQFQMGYRGFIQLGMRSGQYKTINACAVYEGELVASNRFTGEMTFDESKRTANKIIGYAAYFKLINGFEKWVYMSVEEAKAHGKRYSKSYNLATGKWQTDFDAMALKTVLKMLMSKYGILSVDMQTAVLADQAIVKKDGEYEYPDNDVVDTEITEPPKSKAKELTDKFSRTENAPAEEAQAMAPGECPDRPGDTMSKAFCDSCMKRGGCPAWPVMP
jgi:recombination protein RecT